MMEKNQANKDDFNMVEKEDVCEYRKTIREMIKHENEIRNQRTNWFLVIQGFLIAGICKLSCDSYLHFLIAIVGIVSSIAFRHAAWRSTLAVSFALACWENRVSANLRTKLPPVSLITKEILDAEKSPKNDNSWEMKIQKLMYRDKTEDELRSDKRWNKRDYLLPYRSLPVLFLIFWSLYLIFNYKIILQLKDDFWKFIF